MSALDRLGRSDAKETITNLSERPMRALLILPLLLLVSGCRSNPLATAAPNLDVMATGTHEPSRGLLVDVKNRGSEALYLGTCEGRIGYVLQRWENGGWTDQNSAVCPAHVSSAPAVLEPGATATFHLDIMEPGEYRIRIWVSTTSTFDEYRTGTSRLVILR